MVRPAVIVSGVCLGEDAWLGLDDFAHACGTDAAFIRLLVDEGLVVPPVTTPGWRFGGDELARVRRIRRLQRAFEANLQSVAVMLDLMEQIDELQARLRQAGL